MLARVQSYLLQGIDALPCEVEVDHDESAEQDRGFKPIIVGLPDAGVKESHERVRSAITNSGYFWPRGRVLINLAPADQRKEGPAYDLPIAIGLLMVQGIVETSPRPARQFAGVSATSAPAVQSLQPAALPALDHRRFLFAGELALDGRLRPVKGAIALAALARDRGLAGVILPADNAAEASLVGGIDILGVRTLTEVVGLLNGQIEPEPHPPTDVAGLLSSAAAPIDFAEVRGQEGVKRAIIVAAAGDHNLMTLWSTGRDGTRRRNPIPRRGLPRSWPPRARIPRRWRSRSRGGTSPP